MGASTFISAAPGKDVAEAFANARSDAAYWHGHGGYTGTIAEKDSYVLISPAAMPRDEAMELANRLLDEDDPRISDKWGPAGAVLTNTGEWLFFGWASC